MKTTTLFAGISLATTAMATAIPMFPTLPVRSNTRPIRLLHTAPKPYSSPPLFQGARIFSQAQTEESTIGGAAVAAAGSDHKVTSVSAAFVVPHARMPTTGPTANNSAGMYAASFHVGIDSFNAGCGADKNRFIRAGVDVFWDGAVDGEQNPWVWYQSSPTDEDGLGFTNFSVAAGDLVRFSVTGAEVKVENFGANVTCVKGLKAKQSVVQKIDGEGLCGGEAAWAVEDFPLAGLPNFPVPLADFGGVVFKEVEVGFEGGSNETVSKNAEGAEVRDVRLAAQGGRLTACEVIEGGKKVKCDRVVEE
ncbi:putative acid proteinase [Triangularia verruculosa]|uniref:Acid proteinase n=1 Tax=Triangularia verruculosa TaxID=2587418 RepID=A0AAN7AYP7_9PEZI|nr:putative acid proteinase [Triangularia verruculosa]